MKENLKKVLHKHERGQAIVLIAAVMIGIVAMVGLVADTGLLLIEYGKLKRGVDAAAVAAAQQYGRPSAEVTQQVFLDAATNFLNLNQTNGFASIDVHSCLPADPEPPELCNDDPSAPEDNRKLVEVTATEIVNFGFLSVIGIKSTTITASAVGEAATMDIVLVIDTSASMAYETRDGGNDFRYDPDSGGLASENPEVCNQSGATYPCQPLYGVKQAALEFIETLNFGYDRVGVISLTGQETDGSADRHPTQVLALTSAKGTVQAAINGLKVYQPHRCDPDLDTQEGLDDYDPDNDPSTDDDPGVCIRMVNSSFESVICQSMEVEFNSGFYNYAPCPSSNIGGALRLAGATLSGTDRRLDAYWVVLVLMSGPATSTDTPENYPDTLYDDGIPADFPHGYCPANEYYPSNATDVNDNGVYDYKFCTDGDPSDATRHAFSDTIWFPKKQVVFNPDDTRTVTYPTPQEISIYDPDDYARDRADNLANLLNGTGVTIYTIGLGKEVRDTSKGEPEPLAETLLEYIALEAGREEVKHGQYFYAPTFSQLQNIFEAIAENIATKISQ
jgi:hypothetical protein